MKSVFQKIVGVLISLMLIYFAFHKIDLSQTLNSFSEFNFYYLFLIAPIYYMGFILRRIRWKQLLVEKLECKDFDLMSFLFIGYMMNSFMPARAGDIYRAHLLGTHQDIKRFKVFASIVMERILDGSVVFCFLLFAVSNFFQHDWLFKLSYTVGAIFLGGFVLLFLMAQNSNSDKFFNALQLFISKLPELINKPICGILENMRNYSNSFIDGLIVFKHPKKLFISTFLTSLIWLCEGMVVYSVLLSFNMDLSFVAAMFLLSLLVFSGLIPATSTMLGPYQFAYIKALEIFGIASEKAAAVAITNNIIVLVLVFIIGMFFFYRQQFSLKDISSQTKTAQAE